ncbi:MAG: HIT family protein [Armatimonadota bacterium]
MRAFAEPEETIVLTTPHWQVNHRLDVTLPGYLMVGAVDPNATDWADLSPEALAALGGVLADCVQAITECLHPVRVYVGRYGHTPGHTLHFHLIPIYDWLIEAYRQDERYRFLESLYEPSNGTDPDGADLTLFVWREFGERHRIPPYGLSVAEAISLINQTLQTESREQ